MTVDNKHRTFGLVMTAAILACFLARPAAAQIPVTDAAAITAIGVAATGLALDIDAAITAQTADLDGFITAQTASLNGSINGFDGNMTRMMGYPSTGTEASAIATEINLLKSAAPTAPQLLRQIPGETGPNSATGTTLAAAQRAAMLADEASFTTAPAQALNNRMMATLNGIHGNALESLTSEELAATALPAMAKTMTIQPSLGASLTVSNQLSVGIMEQINDLKRVVNNNTIAATLSEKHRVEAERDRELDLDASQFLFP